MSLLQVQVLHGSELLQVEVLSKEGFLEVVWKRWRKVAWWGQGSCGGLSSRSKPPALKRWSPLHLQPLQALHPLLQGAQLHQRLHLCQSLGRNWFPVHKPARKVRLTGPRTADQGGGTQDVEETRSAAVQQDTSDVASSDRRSCKIYDKCKNLHMMIFVAT